MEGGDIHGAPVCARSERARRVAEEAENLDGRPSDRATECEGVEDPDVRAPDSRRCQLRIACSGNSRGDRRMTPVLSAMRRTHEGAIAARSREHDVARLIADQQGSYDAWRCGTDVDDADAVG